MIFSSPLLEQNPRFLASSLAYDVVLCIFHNLYCEWTRVGPLDFLPAASRSSSSLQKLKFNLKIVYCKIRSPHSRLLSPLADVLLTDSPLHKAASPFVRRRRSSESRALCRLLINELSMRALNEHRIPPDFSVARVLDSKLFESLPFRCFFYCFYEQFVTLLVKFLKSSDEVLFSFGFSFLHGGIF